MRVQNSMQCQCKGYLQAAKVIEKKQIDQRIKIKYKYCQKAYILPENTDQHTY